MALLPVGYDGGSVVEGVPRTVRLALSASFRAPDVSWSLNPLGVVLYESASGRREAWLHLPNLGYLP